MELREAPHQGWQSFIGSTGSVNELCERVSGAPWAVEMRGFGELLDCEFSEPLRSDFRTMGVLSGYGMRLYALARQGRGWSVIALLQDVPWLPTETGDARLVRTEETINFAGTRVVYFESRGEFTNYDRDEANGFNRRDLTVCVRTHSGFRCTRVPLEMEFWSADALPRRLASEEIDVADRRIASATAVVRRNGTLRLTLEQGSWRHLYGGAWFNPDPIHYPSEGTTHIIRYEPARQPDPT